ncbi:putative ATP-dependent RNA helicase DDX27 [Orchesella cincta]|uniref:RNA helicase n=1 Tax=Orchesella cincta TaxID=48709 RepID=A0A1D2NC81_ORCCI|nr:putative ATP-dependent RNA helicase DDX27 [Orchesella cincta]
MDLIKTIDEEENPEVLSEDSASDDEFQPTRKRVKTSTNSGFDPGFDFGHFVRDVWSEKLATSAKSVQQQLKKGKMTAPTSLNDKIDKVRKKKLKNGEENGLDESVVEVKEESDSDSNSSEEEEDESAEDSDMVESDNSMSGRVSKKNKKLKKKASEITEDDDIELSDDELKEDQVVLKQKKKGKKAKKEEVPSDDEDVQPVARLEDDPDFTFETDMSFQQMNLSRPLLKAITSLGFTHPTPIQAAAIPVALAGRDICGCAATGTGKTAAYMLPVLERLLYKPKSVSVTRVLCLVPTRELGVQVYTVTKNLCSFSQDIQVGLAVGGLDVQSQEAVLRLNPDVVIATPGRLIDHLGNTPSFTLDAIEILILDEADRMLDEWFAEQLKEIIKQCSPRRQTLLFSATMTDRVKDLATVSLKDPCKIFVDSNRQVAFNLRQQFVKIRNEGDREAILCSLIVRTFHSKTMIFVPTKKIAHRLHIILGLLGIRIGELHGDLSQLQRLDSLKRFQGSEFDVLIVTDVAARGLDIPGVLSVLNYTMPPTLEQYIHRCGRTARAGRSGVAISLVGEQDRKLMKLVTKSATHPVKARIIPPEIIVKYRDKLASLAEEIESVANEEEAEKSLAKAEIEANKALKMINDTKTGKKKRKRGKGGSDGVGVGGGVGGEKGRVWFQNSNERKAENEKLKGRGPAQMRQALKDAEDDKKMKKIVEFQARQAKRKRERTWWARRG